MDDRGQAKDVPLPGKHFLASHSFPVIKFTEATKWAPKSV